MSSGQEGGRPPIPPSRETTATSSRSHQWHSQGRPQRLGLQILLIWASQSLVLSDDGWSGKRIVVLFVGLAAVAALAQVGAVGSLWKFVATLW